MKRVSVLLALSLALLAATVHVAQAEPEKKTSYIVIVRPSADPDTIAKRHGNRYGVEKRFVYRHAVNGYAGRVPESRVDDVRADPDVVSVSADRPFRLAAQLTPTGVERVRALTTSNRGLGTNIAVIDTGIDRTHPDLAPNIASGFNCGDGPTGAFDDLDGHGTHVSGTIAAVDDGAGVRGVAPQAKLWPVRVFDSGSPPEASASSIICGLNFVDARSPFHGGPITVANMSLEAPAPNADDGNCGNSNGDPVHQAVCTVVAHGVTVVAAAGNAGGNVKDWIPAAYDEVIAVTALTDTDGQPCGEGALSSIGGSDDRFASFSNVASGSDLAHTIGAPGVDIVSTYLESSYAVSSGTSMAAPHVAAAAAVYKSEHPSATPDDVLDGLLATGEPGGVNWHGECTGTSSHTAGTHPEPVVAMQPTIFTIIPPPSASAPVGVQFAEDVTGVDNSNVVLRPASGGANLPATVDYNSTTHVATLQPTNPLVAGDYYTIVVAPSGSTPPEDENGDPLPESALTFRSALVEQETSVWARPFWRKVATSSAYGGSLIQDRTAYATAIFKMTSSQVAWYTKLGPDQGKAKVYIDGVYKGTFDNYRSSALYRYKRAWRVPAGTHEIRIVVLGVKRAGATDSLVTVDAFGAWSTIWSTPAVSIAWRSQATSVASGGKALQDRTGSASISFHFRGTGVDWRTLLGPNQGIARVYIDGVYRGQFDNYATSLKGFTRSFRGLSDAGHDIKILVMGTKRSASKDTMVSVDYWRVI